MNINYVLVGLTILAMLCALSDGWWPWGTRTAVILICIVLLLQQLGRAL